MGAFKALGFNFLLKVYTLFLSNGTYRDSRLVPSELFLISMKHCMLYLPSGIMFILCDFLTSSCNLCVLQLVKWHETSVTFVLCLCSLGLMSCFSYNILVNFLDGDPTAFLGLQRSRLSIFRMIFTYFVLYFSYNMKIIVVSSSRKKTSKGFLILSKPEMNI